MVVEESLGQMSVNGVEFETVKVTSRFNVFCQSTNVLKRFKSDFEDVALTGGLQLQTRSSHVRLSEPEALADFGLFEPMLQPVEIGVRCVNVNDRLPRNSARMSETVVVNHQRRHAGVVLVRMHVEKPSLNHRHAAPQGLQVEQKPGSLPTSTRPTC